MVITSTVLITAALFTGVLFFITNQSAKPPAVPSDPKVAEVPETKKASFAQTQQAAFEGRWKIVEFIPDPDISSTSKVQTKAQRVKERVLSTTWKFLGNQLIVSTMKDGEDSVAYTGTYTIARGRNGRVFDFEGKTPDGFSMGYAGIYELDGDSLKVTYAYLNDPANQSRQEARPTSFDPKGMGFRVATYRFKRIGK